MCLIFASSLHLCALPPRRRRRSVGSARSWSSVWTGPGRAACCRAWPPGNRRLREADAGPPAASTSWASTPPRVSWISLRVRLPLSIEIKHCRLCVESMTNGKNFLPFLFSTVNHLFHLTRMGTHKSTERPEKVWKMWFSIKISLRNCRLWLLNWSQWYEHAND